MGPKMLTISRSIIGERGGFTQKYEANAPAAGVAVNVDTITATPGPGQRRPAVLRTFKLALTAHWERAHSPSISVVSYLALGFMHTDASGDAFQFDETTAVYTLHTTCPA